MAKRKYTDEQKSMFLLQLEVRGYPGNESALAEVSRPVGAPSQKTLKAWWVGKDGDNDDAANKVTPKKEAPSPAEIQQLLTQHNGNVSAVARHLGYKSRGRLYRLINESEELQGAVEDARESFVDEVESALYHNALDGNVAAQIFIMKAHPVAKKRGWGERQEIGNATGEDGAPLPFRIVDYRAGLTEVAE